MDLSFAVVSCYSRCLKYGTSIYQPFGLEQIVSRCLLHKLALGCTELINLLNYYGM